MRGINTSYLVIDNKVRTETCDLNVVHYCNLSCRGCNHLSPALAEHVVDPDAVFEEFSLLAEYYHPKYVDVLGGEPLLHPALPAVIRAVRRSGVSDRIRVLTNGLLLPQMSDVFWQEVDEVQVSVYPGKGMSVEQLEHCQSKAKLWGVDLQLRHFDRFRDTYSELGTKDRGLVGRIYETCQFAHLWRCHNFSDGFLFRCPQSLFIPKLISNDVLAHPTIDGIKITDSPTFGGDLLAYLESPEPLASCHHCLGSVGKSFAHEQVSRRVWRLRQRHSTEELIDMEYLAALEEMQPLIRDLAQGKAWLGTAYAQLMRSHQELKDWALGLEEGYQELKDWALGLEQDNQQTRDWALGLEKENQALKQTYRELRGRRAVRIATRLGLMNLGSGTSEDSS